MNVIYELIAAIVLVLLTLVLQSTGMAGLIKWARAHFVGAAHGHTTLGAALLMVRFSSLLFCLHLLQILLWAAFYRCGSFATWESAFYFSATSFSTVGNGDEILKPAWRAIGAIESVTGVLMCGLSASFLFAVVTRLVASKTLVRSEPDTCLPARSSVNRAVGQRGEV